MMRRGLLSDLFDGVGVKRLAVVDADPTKSNQHEVTGSEPLLAILGKQDRKLQSGGEDGRFNATYIWLEGEQEAIREEGRLSWYDSRRNSKRSAEWRLYYQTNSITKAMHPGNFLFLARKHDGHLLFIVTPAESSIKSQLLWLFGLDENPELEFVVKEIKGGHGAELDFAARYILDELEVDIEEPESDRLDSLIEPFGLEFPTTKKFSELARSSLPHISASDNPDDVLMAWVEQELALFRRLERHILAERLNLGFSNNNIPDVEGFLQYSMGVQNRRKSRAGQSLENHLEELFKVRNISYSRGAITENKNKPDFLFPGQEKYHDKNFLPANLTMLAAKSTLKDRWRQVLSEASRIAEKHLLTLEPRISENQTNEMKAKDLQLVLPKKLHETFSETQKPWLMSLTDFIKLVEMRQTK